MRGWMAARARPLSIVVTVVLVLVAGVVAFTVLNSTKVKHATVLFPSTIGIYKGSSVRLLGVPVGQVDSVDPQGTVVKVTLTYKASTQLPSDVGLAQVPPSIVSDRYLEFTPGYTGGPQLADHATIPETKTEVPVELDQIFGSLNDLNVALGPNGVNKNGALSQLVDVGAANLQGNGALFNTTLKGFSKAINALSNSRDALFGTITSLQKFTTTLAQDDSGVRTINGQLATVTGQLAGERADLGAALANLATALNQVQAFVADNSGTLTHDVGALTTVTSGLVSEQQAIKEVLDEAPPALHNLGLSFDQTATTCSNVNPSQCSVGALSTRLDNGDSPSGLVCALITNALPDLLGTKASLVNLCKAAAGGGAPAQPAPPSPSTLPSVPSLPVPTTSVPLPALPRVVPSLPVLPTPALPSLPSVPSVGGLLGGSGTGTSSSGGAGGLGGLGSILMGGLG